MLLQPLGKADFISSYGNIVIRTTTVPKIGTKVYDERKRVVGKVARIFGPVTRPYIAIAPANKSLALQMLGKNLYVGVVELGKTKKEKRYKR